ncbi:hypothetical protein [Membranihabitans maritimus]|uniref:hypothetical protein n=1 Tax=Membranihabitans maritimus TaxID=2904244 RepID=UPI001F42826E|nr:hypothetical protein [Membranihabitans maritimus]
MKELGNLSQRVKEYQSVVKNTKDYRNEWEGNLKPRITDFLNQVIEETGISATIETRDQLGNLEALVFTLGVEPSGIYERVGEDFKKNLYKSNGMLIFQQLFNGKLIIMIAYPHIEEVAKPKPSKTIEIIRPDELTDAFLIRYMDTFLSDMIKWEDFDDNVPQKIGFNSGFQDNGLVV